MSTVAPWSRAASILAIGASSGTNTSHGTPRARAAAARLCAWLPAAAGDHAGRAAAVAERGELGRRAAQLERAGALQVLGLQRDHAARPLGDRARREHRGPARNRVHRRPRRRDVGGGHPAPGIDGHPDDYCLASAVRDLLARRCGRLTLSSWARKYEPITNTAAATWAPIVSQVG